MHGPSRRSLLFVILCCAHCHDGRSATCRDVDDNCQMWAQMGECEKNPGYMKISCAVACDSCGWEDLYCTTRASGQVPAKGRPGDITATFERMLTFTEYKPKVHSSPELHGPWILTYESFVSDEEAEAFLSTTADQFERSMADDRITSDRTSDQAWCQNYPCVDHPLVNQVHDRVINMTGVPKENAEFFQVLKYERGQYYKAHHDQNAHAESLIGRRLFTFFMYLNTPARGGHTYFPLLNITIEPRKGTALMWPNVQDDDPSFVDERTRHEALPVEEGIKYCANLWLHQYDFRGPNVHGCDMKRLVQRLTPADAKPDL